MRAWWAWWAIELILWGVVLAIGILTGQWAGLPLIVVAFVFMVLGTMLRMRR